MDQKPTPSIGSPFDEYADLHAILRARAEQLSIGRLEIDRIGKLQPGYSSKILNMAQSRGLGLKTLAPMLRALGLKLIVIEDPSATMQVLLSRTPRIDHQCRHKPGTDEVRCATTPADASVPT